MGALVHILVMAAALSLVSLLDLQQVLFSTSSVHPQGHHRFSRPVKTHRVAFLQSHTEPNSSAYCGHWGSAAAVAASVAAVAAFVNRCRVTARVTARERMQEPDFNPVPPDCLRQISGGIIGDHDVLEMENGEAVATLACRKVADALAEAIKWRGSAALAMAGGSSTLATMSGLVEAVHGGKLVAVDWSKVHIAYVNHKCVPLDDERSTHRKALEVFAKKLDIPSDNIVVPNGSSDGPAEASAYQKKLLALDSAVLPKDADGMPVFDVLLIGVGADGRIGSLYPGRSEVTRRDSCVLHVEQGGQPASITLSLPVMNAAREVIVVAQGGEKAAVLNTALRKDAGDDGQTCPAQALHPKEVSTWILDEAAADQLKGVAV